jgi:hypothetical protein
MVRKSEIIVLVNTTEKVTLLKFSIRSFGSVYVPGAKRIAPRNFLPFRLTAVGRHVRELATTRGKSRSHEHEHRRPDSPGRGLATAISGSHHPHSPESLS